MEPAALTRPPRRLLSAPGRAGRPRATWSSVPAELPGRRGRRRRPRQPERSPPSAARRRRRPLNRAGSEHRQPRGRERRRRRRRRKRPTGGPRGERGAEEESLGAGGSTRRGRGARWRAPAGRTPGGQQIDEAGEVAAATSGAAHPASSRGGPGSKAARLRD